MSILKANLKHLYQRRGLWFLYVLIGMVMLAVVSTIVEHYHTLPKGIFVIMLTMSNVIGLFACSMQIDIAIKPFALCLPGHRKVKRQFLLIVAIIVNLLFALIFLLYPGIGISEKFFAVGAAFFAGMVSFWIGALIAFSGNASAGFLVFYPVVGIIISKYDLHIAMERAIAKEPASVCVIGLIVSVAAWVMLSSEGWFRRHCGAQWFSLFDAWNWGKLRKQGMQRTVNLEHGVLSRVFEKLCLSRVTSASMRLKGYFAGTIYATLGPAFCKKFTSVIISFSLILVVVCALGYLKGAQNMVYLFAGIMAVNVRMPVHSTMLIAGGRRERFMTTCFMAVVITALLSGVVTLLALLTHAIEMSGVMPSITIEGALSQYRPISLLGFYVPFIMVPVGFAIQLIFNRKQIPMMVAWVMFLMFVGIGAMLIDVSNVYWVYAIAVVVAGSWVVFLGVLRWVCMTRPLVI